MPVDHLTEHTTHRGPRALALPVLLLLFATACLASARITLHAPTYAGQRATLYRYHDLFTLRTERIAEATIDAHGDAVLQGEVSGTTKAVIRIGDVVCDLWLRDGALEITVPAPTPDAAHTLSGIHVDPVLTDPDPMDVNALLSDLNERLDGFVAQDLATDSRAAMQAVDSTRRNHGTLRPDTAARRTPLYVTPNWSDARVDTFEVKLRRFYAEVKDPWFWNDLEYGIAGLRFGPRANDRTLFTRYLKDKTVLYTVPEYVRFVRSFFEDHLIRFPFHTHETALINTIRAADMDSLKHILARHDFLHDDRLCELVMLDQLYANYPGKTFDREGILRILHHAAAASTYPEHRRIAADMVWDLTVMRVGGALPDLSLRTTDGAQLRLDSMPPGPTYIAVTASWSTYCEQEMIALAALYKEYGTSVRIIAISLDHDMAQLNAYVRAHPDRDWSWAYGGDSREVEDALRLRNVPAFFALNEGRLILAPAPPPSNGAAAYFHKWKAESDERNKLRPDQGPPPRR